MKLKKVRPLWNHILTTCDRYPVDNFKDGLVSTDEAEGEIKIYQKVIAVGNTARDIKVGDLVLLNPRDYLRPVHSLNANSVLEKDEDSVSMVINWPILYVDDKECLYLYDKDVDMVIEEMEEN